MANSIKDPRTRRWATIALLVLCAVVLGRLVLSLASVWGGPSSTTSSPTPAPAQSGTSSAARTPSQGPLTPVAIGANAASLHLDELAQLNGRPLPDFERNPFQYGPSPEEIKAQKQAEELAKNPPPPVAPPPPPVPFRAIGYQQAAGGQRVAYLCVSGGGAGPGAAGGGGGGGCAEDQEPYAVREGQEFGQHFKVLRITDSMVEVQDESYHQTVQLPFPQ
jgi:hypothetical protein